MIRETTEVRQQQIKKAVLNIITEEGMNNISTRNIAKRVGLTDGALFRHFHTKRDILIGIMEDVANDLIGNLKNISQNSANAEEKLKSFLCQHIHYLKKNKGVTILLFSEATHLGDKGLKDALYQILTEIKQMVTEIVNQGMNEDVWDNTLNSEDIAMLYMGIPITLNIELVLNKNNFDVDDFSYRMYSLILRSLRNKTFSI